MKFSQNFSKVLSFFKNTNKSRTREENKLLKFLKILFLKVCIFFITTLFFIAFLISFLPIIGYQISWYMLAVFILLFFILFFSFLSPGLQKMTFIETWFRFSFYAVLVGLVATSGCNIEAQKYLNRFKKTTQIDRIDLEQAWKKISSSGKNLKEYHP